MRSRSNSSFAICLCFVGWLTLLRQNAKYRSEFWEKAFNHHIASHAIRFSLSNTVDIAQQKPILKRSINCSAAKTKSDTLMANVYSKIDGSGEVAKKAVEFVVMFNFDGWFLNEH